jgi:cell division protein FtsQ
MSARIARGGATSRKGRGSGSRGATSVRTRKAKPTGMLGALGASGGAGRRIGFWVFLGMAAVLAFALLFAFRVPHLAGTALAESIGNAGFTMRRVEIKGAARVSRLDIYNIAFDQPSMAMPLLDLESTRARLMRFGWVKEARVHRRLPDTLVIDIVERRPAAIWQNGGRLTLIDGEGVELERVRVEATPELPLVIGPEANRHLAALDRLLANAPHLRPQVQGASWVGGRRWDVRFQTGEVLALPEGDDAARRAVLVFARMDQQRTMLGHGYARFDMRIPGRLIVDISRNPGSSVPALVPPDPGPVPADLARTI